MLNISDKAEQSGIEMLTVSSSINGKAYGQQRDNHKYIDNKTYCYIHKIIGYFFGDEFHGSYLSTLRLIKIIKKYRPDVIHFHNIHGYYLNIGMLLKFFQHYSAKYVFTMHDCWSFTGRCPQFLITQCNYWKTGCKFCKFDKHLYPASWLCDRSKTNYIKKKELFKNIKNLTLVTPSKWLASLTRESFLSQFPVEVINNGVDLSIFKPTESKFREEHHVINKKIVLAVAFNWGKRKGLDVIVELANRLDSDEYQIIMVGTNSKIDQHISESVISIHRTNSQEQLAELYSTADVFINPTREDNYPTVNMESIACGTPVITFRTGGSPEIIDEHSGIVVDVDDIDALEKEIKRICTDKPFSIEDCLQRAKSFDMKDRFEDYIRLYQDSKD